MNKNLFFPKYTPPHAGFIHSLLDNNAKVYYERTALVELHKNRPPSTETFVQSATCIPWSNLLLFDHAERHNTERQIHYKGFLIMTDNKIKEICELSEQIKKLSARLEELKAEFRADSELTGTTVYTAENKYTVQIRAGGMNASGLDTKAFKTKAPALYAECLRKYPKAATARAAQVLPTTANK